MSYVTKSDIQNFIGTETLSNLLRDENETTDNNLRMSIAIQSASATVDSYLVGRSVIPMDEPVLNLIFNIVQDLTVHEVSKGRAGIAEGWEKNAEAALESLKAIKAGTMNVPGLAKLTKTVFSSNTTGKPKTFSAQTMRGYDR